ncbi:MAG TPA: hypothetical protein VF456_28155 [Vicinamibacterales bacterium]
MRALRLARRLAGTTQVVHFHVHYEVRDGTRDQLTGLAAALCAGAAIWCSLGTLGLTGEPPDVTRVALVAPVVILPVSVLAVFAVIRVLRLTTRQQLPLFGSLILVLPWLPIRVPPAALIWTGPITVIVWAAVLAGLLIEVLRGLNAPRWAADPHRAPLVAALLTLALYGASAVWLSPVLPDGDEPHYLILAQSLIKDGDLRIENNHRRGDYLEYSLNAAAPDYLRRGVNGEIYSIHAPGLAVLIAPAMWAFGYPGVVAFLGIVAAISTALVWYVAYLATENAVAAWFGWACCALTTPFFFQATEVFPDGIAATCLLIGTLCFWDGLKAHPLQNLKPAATDAKVDGLKTKVIDVVAGASLGILPWLQTRLAVLAIAAAICVALRVRDRRRLLAFATVPLISAALWFGFFIVVYGTPNPTAPYGPYTQTSPANLIRGFPGLLFDQQFGLIPNAPVYGFVLAGVLVAALKRQRWAWETLALIVPYMAAVGSYQMWWGGTSVPARFLTPLTLILGAAAARVWHGVRSNGTRALGILTLIASVLVTLALLAPERGRLLLNFRDGISLWLEWASAVVDLPKGLPSVFRDDRAHLWLKVAIWATAFGIMWTGLRVIGLRESRGFRLSWTSTWCAAIAVMIAFTLAWRVDGAMPLTPETAKLNLFGHWSSFRTEVFDFNALRFESGMARIANMRIETDHQRRPTGSSALFSAQDMPAGHYGVHFLSAQSGTGTVTVHAGSAQLPLATLAVKTYSEPSAGAGFTLQANLRSLTIDADSSAPHSGLVVELTPMGTLHNGRGGTAHRAVRYESGNVFFLDEHAYPEPIGFWVAGGRESTVVLATHTATQGLFVRNAPISNHVTIDVDGHAQELTLAPGEEQLVALPRADLSGLRVRITSQSGFRPSTAEPGSTDMRYLGCWIELR